MPYGEQSVNSEQTGGETPPLQILVFVGRGYPKAPRPEGALRGVTLPGFCWDEISLMREDIESSPTKSEIRHAIKISAPTSEIHPALRILSCDQKIAIIGNAPAAGQNFKNPLTAGARSAIMVLTSASGLFCVACAPTRKGQASAGREVHIGYVYT